MTLVITSAPDFTPEAWEVVLKPGQIAVRAPDDRGLVYGLAALRQVVDLQKAVPGSLSLKRSPRFKVRRWSAAISHDFGSPWDERINLAERFAYIKTDILRASRRFRYERYRNQREAGRWLGC